MTRLALVGLALALALWPHAAPAADPPRGLRTTFVGTFFGPTDIEAPPGDTRRLFVVEQVGTVQLLLDGIRRATPFLDLRGRVDASTEGGLLSIALAPDYAESGRFYVYYMDDAHELRLVEYRRDATNPDVADPATARLLLRQAKFGALNHNGGMLQFGPDGRLYLSVGDSGSFGGRLAQRPDTIYGKILVVDPVSATWSTWANGLRNPWRFWFDQPSGLLYIADVGAGKVEEIDRVPFAQSGWNFGWPCFEGTNRFDEAESCANVTGPVYQYGHGDGACSITGGVVVRDPRLTSLQGAYLFGDFCGRRLRALRPDGTIAELGEPGRAISFGVDALDRVYVGTYEGAVWRLDPCRLAPEPVTRIGFADRCTRRSR